MKRGTTRLIEVTPRTVVGVYLQSTSTVHPDLCSELPPAKKTVPSPPDAPPTYCMLLWGLLVGVPVRWDFTACVPRACLVECTGSVIGCTSWISTILIGHASCEAVPPRRTFAVCPLPVAGPPPRSHRLPAACSDAGRTPRNFCVHKRLCTENVRQ